MRCRLCRRGFKDGDPVLAVQRYVTNEKRGDFVGGMPGEYVHLRCVTPVVSP